jgi:tetratricopeptide (TPR) repeat protein
VQTRGVVSHGNASLSHNSADGKQLIGGALQSEEEGALALKQRDVLLTALFSGLTFLLFAARPVFAQDPSSTPAAKPQDQPKPKPNTDNATQSAPDQPKWDPLRADKDIEVGKYYMNKGDVDAAIDRFIDAIDAKPGFAIPYRYLGEAYEKKGQKKPAVKAYQRYLDLYPKAEDGDKIRKKIEKLHKEIDKEKAEAS